MTSDFDRYIALRVFNDAIAEGRSYDEAMLLFNVVQRDQFIDAGAPPGVIDLLNTEITGLMEATGIGETEPSTPSGPFSVLDDAADVVTGVASGVVDRVIGVIAGMVPIVEDAADSVKDAALRALGEALPSLAEVAVSLAGNVDDALGFIGQNMADLDDLSLGMATGIISGFGEVSGEIGLRIIGALSNALIGFFVPVAEVPNALTKPDAIRLELGKRA